MHTFEAITEANTEQAHSTLVAAFRDDPVMNWLSPRSGMVPTIFDFAMPLYRERGDSYLSACGQGAIQWAAPGVNTDWPINLSSLWTFIRAGGLAALPRLELLERRVTRSHPEIPHFYLFAIGTTPRARGTGLGSALMKLLTRECDETGMPAYLENSREANLGFYAKHGFEVIREARATKNAPPMWLMWREPRAA